MQRRHPPTAHRLPGERERDNTWGRGYIPPTSELSGLGRFADALRPTEWLDHKVWPEEHRTPETHMVTIAAGPRLSITARDLESLFRLGLSRIQSNEPGELSFYFEVESPRPLIPHRRTR